MIDCRKIAAQRHVVDVIVCFLSAQWRIDQFAVLSGQRNAPRFKMLLQRLELCRCQIVPDAPRSTVRQKGHMPVAQSEPLGCVLRALSVVDFHDFTFSKVVASTVRP